VGAEEWAMKNVGKEIGAIDRGQSALGDVQVRRVPEAAPLNDGRTRPRTELLGIQP